MKIAAACTGAQMCQHFGHCENFMIFEAEDGKILSEQSIRNPGHRPGFLPNFLADKGVNVMIAGGIGGGAIEIFGERGIEVVTGAQGGARAAAEAFLSGALRSTGSVCREHAHHDDCGGH
ncbi:MAG: dinitrogenase iron-molybdenum cofactor [Clostridiales bacterium]|nr:dinitrogenase iron-molybdenum cofactor [Clostridiales bacterium]